jgi:hypothetical protein
MLLVAMLAMILVAAAPVLAQDTQDLDAEQCQVILGDLTGGAGGVAIADASGGDVSVTVINRCEQIIEQTIINRTDTGDANGGGGISGGGGDVVVSGSGGDVVIGGGGIKTVGTTVFEGAAVPVFVDKAGAHFIVVKDEPVVIEKGAVTFVKTADVTNVQYQKKATNVQYQYKAGVVQYQDAAPVKKTTLTVLPDTGGASLITLGAGTLLVAGGMLARGIVR